MTEDDKTSNSTNRRAATAKQNDDSKPGWFSVPAPVKRIFDSFPLISYPANSLPRRSPEMSDTPVLYIFITKNGALRGEPSFNPACLKWQAYLLFSGVDFKPTPSNNHASPTGALPFILPNSGQLPGAAITSNNIQKWASSQAGLKNESTNMRHEAYSSLLDHRIRSAWLYNLYLDESNFNAVAKRLYIYPTTSNPIIRATLSHQLQLAAREELLKFSAFIDEDDLYVEAERAFQALAALLGEDMYFFESEFPGLFDASVFAYTHLLLDNGMGWKNERLSKAMKESPRLVEHRQRLLERNFQRK